MNLSSRNAIKYLAGSYERMRPEGLKVPSTFLGQSGGGPLQPAEAGEGAKVNSNHLTIKLSILPVFILDK